MTHPKYQILKLIKPTTIINYKSNIEGDWQNNNTLINMQNSYYQSKALLMTN